GSRRWRDRDRCGCGPGPGRSRGARGAGGAHPQPSERSLARGLAPCTEAYRPVRDPDETSLQMSYASGVDLPDGYVAFVKASCPTCRLVAPALLRLRKAGAPLTVSSQDDPRFPEGAEPLDDSDLRRSYEAGVEVVPT